MNGNHMMFDFETLGQDPDTKVLSLGAVVFNKKEILAEKYWVYDMNQPGRTEDPSTIDWWKKQSAEARMVFEVPQDQRIALENFIPELYAWGREALMNQGSSWDRVKVWSNGADFDLPILVNILKRTPGFEATVPWKFWNSMCYRTYKAMTNCDKLVTRTGAHNALEDARWQAQTLIADWNGYTAGIDLASKPLHANHPINISGPVV